MPCYKLIQRFAYFQFVLFGNSGFVLCFQNLPSESHYLCFDYIFVKAAEAFLSLPVLRSDRHSAHSTAPAFFNAAASQTKKRKPVAGSRLEYTGADYYSDFFCSRMTTLAVMLGLVVPTTVPTAWMYRLVRLNTVNSCGATPVVAPLVVT